MQPYYAIKLKCFILRLMMGCSLLLISIGITVSIVQEIMESYDVNSKLAYILGLVICALMVLLGVWLIYQAFHFERFVFGKSKSGYALLKEDMQNESVVSAGDLIVTDQFLLLFSLHLLNMCKVIRLDNIIACFEDPVYGTVAKPSEYTLFIYDRDFKCHTIVLDAKQSEAGHLAKLKISQTHPWIYAVSRDTFLDRTMTKNGRRNFLNEIEKRKYKMSSHVNVEAEAETEIDQMVSDARKKLVFIPSLEKSIKTNRRKNKMSMWKNEVIFPHTHFIYTSFS